VAEIARRAKHNVHDQLRQNMAKDSYDLGFHHHSASNGSETLLEERCKVQTSQASSRSRIPNRRSRGIWEGRISTCTVGVYGLDEADFLDNC